MRFLAALIFACFSLLVPTSSASAQGFVPGDSPFLRAACLQWLEDNPDFEPIFQNLPPVCLWHYAGWDCEQDWTPAGWLRPGGYCEQAKSVKSLVPTGKGQTDRHRYDCEYQSIGVAAMPPGYCYPNNN